MNIGAQYGRRRAQFMRSGTSYIHMQSGSRDSLGNESDDENEETSSCSAISTQSTRSLKSYKRWRRSQRERRRNLKRTGSLQIEPFGATTLEALDLSGDHSKSACRETTDGKSGEVTKTQPENIENPTKNEYPRILSTIAQSPLDPYYSSSPLTSSTDDTDSESSPKRSNTSDIDDSLEGGNVKYPAPTREPFTTRKDPLHRRTYPFTLSNQQRQRSVDSIQTDFEKIHSRYRGINNPVLPAEGAEIETRRPSKIVHRGNIKSTSDIKEGLNVISSLADDGIKSPRSLLSMAKLSGNTPSPVDGAYDAIETDEKDVFFSDVNGFTISLPSNSPSISAHTLEHDNVFNMETIEETNEIYSAKEDSESRDRINNKQTTNPNGSNGFPKKNKESTTSSSGRPMDPMNRYFLPPLIAQAMDRAERKSRSLSGSDCDDNKLTWEKNSSKTEAAVHDKNSNVKHHAASKGNLELKDDGTSTSSEENDENVYMENADYFLDDLTEKDFMEKPRIKAMPEDGDEDSTLTKQSLDPIEDILTRQNSERADDKTFTLNGRHVITPNLSEKDQGEIKDAGNSQNQPSNTNKRESGDVESSLSSVPDERGCCSTAPRKPTKSRSSTTTDVGSDLCCMIL